MREFLFYYSTGKFNVTKKTHDFYKKLYNSDIDIIEKHGKNWSVLGVSDKNNFLLDKNKKSTNSCTLNYFVGTPLIESLEKRRAESIFDALAHDDNKAKEVDGDYFYFNFNSNNLKVRIVTSKLGLYPCYYYKSGNIFIISSRLSLIKSIVPELEIDHSAIAQFCLYNYVITDRTFYKNVYSIPSASIINVDLNTKEVIQNSYWTIHDELVEEPYNFKDSTKLLDETLDRIIKEKVQSKNKIGISLTGGWDGRLLLAYASKYLDKKQIQLYSFGTPDAPDVFVPKANAKKIGYKYLPIELNTQDYESKKLDFAERTVFYSDGMRSLKRGHYLYTMCLLKNKVELVLSGIGGSNLLKSGKIHSSNVFNKRVLELLYADDLKQVIKDHFDYLQQVFPELFNQMTFSDFLRSFEEKRFMGIFSKHELPSNRMLTFLISDIERKYFGYELMSYRPIVNNYSPFFDMRFIRALAKTSYFGAYGRNKSKLAPLLNARLYAKLVNNNFPLLAKQKTDRGFSLFDVLYPVRLSFFYDYYKMKKYARKKGRDFFNNKDLLESIARKNEIPEIAGLPENEVVSNYASVKMFLEA
jgi:hypothetical protein